MSNYAWVTLATNDSYSLGALVVANSLKNANTVHQTAVLITPGVSESMKRKLEYSFNVVVEVNVLDSKDAANLALLSRPELGITFTKLHSWRLTQFEKCVFLDADTFVLQNADELFDREELSAAPDVGWPDCFNSGVFVFRPSLDTFDKLIEFATRQGSFDGGDQGLLNSFFSDWAHKDISMHLPFIYNTCSTACYSYLPAFKQFGKNVKILHFIGQVKPWLVNFDSSSKTVYPPQGFGHLGEYLQQWWNIFCANVHPALTTEMGGLAGALAQLTLGAPRSSQQEAYEESMRRQCWESGNIDYLGKDSFDNIWKRITKTIETKNDTPPTETNRSPTPQPEEKLVVETKKEVKVGPTFNESEEDNLATAPISEEIVTEVTSDGRIIEKKIVTYPGEETTEIEEVEEVDGQVVSVKRSVIGGDNNKPAQPKPKTLAEIKNEPTVLVPGYKTVVIDEKTNSTIVTEKTTTGYQQTITTTQEDGTKKIQTKTFYDPVEIPGEETEEETYEEIESIEPATETTTTTTITETKGAAADSTVSNKNTVVSAETLTIVEEPASTLVKQVETVVKKEEKSQQDESKALTDLKNQPIVIVPGHQKVEFDKETNTTTVTEKTTTGYQQTLTTVTSDGRSIVQTKVFYDPIPTEQVEEEETTTTTVTEVSNVPTSEDLATIDATDLQLALTAPAGPTTLTQKKTTTEGKEIEVTAVVSEDGKTKTLRKTVRQPSEEIEIEEYEETQSYEPSGEVKVITTKKTIPIVEAIEDAVKDVVDKTEKVVVTPTKVDTKKQVPEKSDSSIQTVVKKEVKSEAKPAPVESKPKTTAAKSTATATKQAAPAVKPTTTTVKQTTTESNETSTEAKEIVSEAKQSTEGDKTIIEAIQTTTEAKETITEALKAEVEAKQTVTDTKKITTAKATATEDKQVTASAKEATTSVKKTITPKKSGAVESKQIKKETKSDQTDSTAKKVSKPSDKDANKSIQTVTTTTKTTTVKKDDLTQKKTKPATDKSTTEIATVGEPKVTTKDGETTTEVVRRIPGGTEHTWTTVRADGTTKTESKTCFDVVELSSDEEYEEYEEIVEEDALPPKAVVTKIQVPTTTSLKGPRTPTITEATPPNTPPLKPLVIDRTSSALKAEHEIPDTPPLDRVEQLSKKKLQSAPTSKVAQKVEKPAAEAPKAPPRKKEVKKPATGK